MGLATFLMVRLVEVVVVILLIVFMPSIPPYINFTEYKVTPSLPLEGKLALNERLNGVQHLYENELKGPEAFADFNGELYSSLHGGDVVKLVKDHIVPVVKFGKPCKGFHEEALCGRPLGLDFDKDGILYIADGYFGIWKVDVKSGKKTQIVSIDKEIEGKKPMIPNSVAISKTGDIYWTDSSTDFKLEDGLYTMLGDGSGRLIHYNPKTKANTVLIDGIHFANGVALSVDEDYVIVAETARSRILRYYLKGAKKGTHDVFIDGLPGMPDNLKFDGKDGFLVPLVFARDADHPAVFQVIGPFPLVRKFVARLLGLAELGFRTIEKIYPNFYTQSAIHWVGHFESVTILTPRRTTILHVSKNGEILDCLHGVDNSMRGMSDVHIFKDHLYLGSPFNNYVGKLSLSKAGLEHLGKYKIVKRSAETAQKPVKETPPTPKAAPVKQAPPPTQAPPPKAAPVKQAPTQAPPPKAAPVKQAPPPTQAPPPKVAPVKQAPPPTAAPVKKAPAPTQAPPKAAPVKQAPPPTAAPVKEAPPTQKQAPPPTKQAPPKAAPVKQAPPQAAPVKEAQPTAAPVKQAQPTAAPVKQAPPTAAPVKQTPPPAEPIKKAPVKETPKPAIKQAPPTPKQAPPPAANQIPPVKQTPPPSAKQTPPARDPPVVPIKEKMVPKSESIPPRK